MKLPRLRRWREIRALTQEELAAKADISARSVAGYEAGAGARLGTVRRLAEALGIEPRDLYGEAHAPKARQLQLPLDIDAITQEVAKAAQPETAREFRQALDEAYARKLRNYSTEELFSLKDELLEELHRMSGPKTREEIGRQAPEEFDALLNTMENTNAVLRALERRAAAAHVGTQEHKGGLTA